MGAYLSAPVKTKDTFQGEGESVVFGGASMQGWRRTMEDAHLSVLGVGSPDTDLFGVFDGHGGPEVARFCQQFMSQEIAQCDGFKRGDMGAALVQVFHRMDDMLVSNQYAKELESFREAGGDSGEASEPNPIELLRKWFDAR